MPPKYSRLGGYSALLVESPNIGPTWDFVRWKTCIQAWESGNYVCQCQHVLDRLIERHLNSLERNCSAAVRSGRSRSLLCTTKDDSYGTTNAAR